MSDTGIVIVNWNGWADTIECLESIFRLDGFDGPVVVCDNGSTDSSIETIEAWAKGSLCALPQSSNREICSLVLPPVPKPIPHIVLSGDKHNIPETNKRRLIIVRVGKNLGFSGANNVGIRILREQSEIHLFWLVNNDALPRRDALVQLRKSFLMDGRPEVGGSVLVEYWNPGDIQAAGALFDATLIRASHHLTGSPLCALETMDRKVATDYPVGASMAVNRAFIEMAGLMNEDYFLYFEEIDWISRAKFEIAPFIATQSIVYHKGGAATQSGYKAKKSKLSDYYWMRGRILFAASRPVYVFLLVLLITLFAICKRIILMDVSSGINAARGALDGFRFVASRITDRYRARFTRKADK